MAGRGGPHASKTVDQNFRVKGLGFSVFGLWGLSFGFWDSGCGFGVRDLQLTI